jgi:hypothetical protein
MLFRYSCFIIENSIENLWLKTINFWNNQKGEMVSTYISDNLLHRKMEFRHDATGQFLNKQFVLSLGETYVIDFGFNQDENCTYITLEVGFRWFGQDNVWWIPQEFINKWLDYLGFESIHLQHGKSPNFLRISENFREIERSKKFHEYCPICGSYLGRDNVCSDCGYSLVDFAVTH